MNTNVCCLTPLADALARAAATVERDPRFSMRRPGHDLRAAVLDAFGLGEECGWLGHGALGERLGLGHAVGHALFTGPPFAGGADAKVAAAVLRYAAGCQRPTAPELAARWCAFIDRARA